ncbi:daptide biosynthesis RiPP recognition protein [Kitasatospora sp. NPDC088346]|uniref:daptide biosynthesis RiPP recognition protein n=1 Tax=Kitasatospora sp. NPDC088346 TaxID=3364073 RepID=UPI003819DCB1
MSGEMRDLMAWATGVRGPRQVIVLEDSRHVGDVREMLGTESGEHDHRIFAPGDRMDAGDHVVGYGGSFHTCDAEASLGDDFYLQVQNYSISEYVSVIGPTLVRLADETDFEVWLRDADTAREKGEFVDFLANPALLVADLPGLGGPLDGAGPRHRLHVRADGEVSVSPYGSALGRLGDRPEDLEAAWQRANAAGGHPCAVALATAVPEARRTAELAGRPWLAEYLTAVDALRELRSRGIPRARVSGFGGRLRPENQRTEPLRTPGRHLVLWTDESAYLYTAEGSRLFELNHAAGELAELLLCRGSVEAAAEHAPPAGLLKVRQFFERAGVVL